MKRNKKSTKLVVDEYDQVINANLRDDFIHCCYCSERFLAHSMSRHHKICPLNNFPKDLGNIEIECSECSSNRIDNSEYYYIQQQDSTITKNKQTKLKMEGQNQQAKKVEIIKQAKNNQGNWSQTVNQEKEDKNPQDFRTLKNNDNFKEKDNRKDKKSSDKKGRDEIKGEANGENQEKKKKSKASNSHKHTLKQKSQPKSLINSSVQLGTLHKKNSCLKKTRKDRQKLFQTQPQQVLQIKKEEKLKNTIAYSKQKSKPRQCNNSKSSCYKEVQRSKQHLSKKQSPGRQQDSRHNRHRGFQNNSGQSARNFKNSQAENFSRSSARDEAANSKNKLAKNRERIQMEQRSRRRRATGTNQHSSRQLTHHNQSRTSTVHPQAARRVGHNNSSSNIRQNSRTFNYISQTLNQQFQVINSQFGMINQIFSNFNNFININIQDGPRTFHQIYEYQYSVNDNSQQQQEEEGLGEAELASIPTLLYNPKDACQQCTVCLVDLKPRQKVKKLSCQHIFHCQCIDEWLRRKPICPICRDAMG